MGIPTLISTSTGTGASSIEITSGIDSTYDEYMFVFTDVNASGDGSYMTVQFNASGGSGFDEVITSSAFRATHKEDDSSASLAIETYEETDGWIMSQNSGKQLFTGSNGADADQCSAGIIHLYSPASTTYVKHFTITSNWAGSGDDVTTSYVGGYINTTAAIDEIEFGINSGTFDAVIQMYGIA